MSRLYGRNGKVRRYINGAETEYKVRTAVSFLVAPPGAGKTLTLQLLDRLANGDTRFMTFDMSDVIRHFRDKHPESSLGKIFIEQKKRQEKGDLIDNKPICFAGLKYVRMIEAALEGRLKHCTFAGAVRNKAQAKFALRRYENPRLIHIDCSREEAIHGSMVRPGENRSEPQTAEMINHRYDVAEGHIDAVVRCFEKRCSHGVLHLQRSQPLLIRMMMIIGHLDIPPETRCKWLERCQNPQDEQVGSVIRDADQGRKINLEKKSPSPLRLEMQPGLLNTAPIGLPLMAQPYAMQPR